MAFTISRLVLDVRGRRQSAAAHTPRCRSRLAAKNVRCGVRFARVLIRNLNWGSVSLYLGIVCGTKREKPESTRTSSARGRRCRRHEQGTGATVDALRDDDQVPRPERASKTGRSQPNGSRCDRGGKRAHSRADSKIVDPSEVSSNERGGPRRKSSPADAGSLTRARWRGPRRPRRGVHAGSERQQSRQELRRECRRYWLLAFLSQ